MRVAIDYTPALTQRAGIGRYVRELVHHLLPLLQDRDELVLWHGRLPSATAQWPELGERVREVELLLSPEWVTRVWQRLRLPVRIERFTGPLSASHGPDFVVPPSRAPAVVTVHDLSFVVTPQFHHPRLRAYLCAAVPRALTRAATVIAVSDLVRRELIDYYRLPEERVTVIPHGIPRDLLDPPATDPIALLERLGVRQPYVLMVGTIEPRKNHQTVLRAFAWLAQRRPELALVIAGRPGWLAEPILSAIHEARARYRVHLLGPVNDDELRALYTHALALLYPSWYEGFGLPVLEAMACGTAVITSEGSAPAELAGEAALTVRPDRPEEIVDALETVATDSAVRERLVAKGHERASHYTWERAAKRHLDVYRALAGDGP